MPVITVPYGRRTLSVMIPAEYPLEIIEPVRAPATADPQRAVKMALDNLLGNVSWSDLEGVRSVAIAINDKTRPVPHEHLLPPLLEKLEMLGVAPQAITLVIATGTHLPMTGEEFSKIIPRELVERYPVVCHDADDEDNLLPLGKTQRGTPILVNRLYMAADLRIVVGNIEPHQFQGFSGGVKSAAIGLAGRSTINYNHAMMVDPQARLGQYDANPARQDVDEIGRFIGIQLALNAVLNDQKEIVHVLAGAPQAVMEAGIPFAREICQVVVPGRFDLVIASPGGHPKDINIYQSQKGLAHASLITRDGGAIILVAACPEGSGSHGYEQWVQHSQSHEEVLQRFQHEEFRVGPHKAFQIAREMTRLQVYLVSDMPRKEARKLLLNPVSSLGEALDQALQKLPANGRIALMPYANATIPVLAVSNSIS